MAAITFAIEDGREITVPLDGCLKLGSAEGNDVVVEHDRIAGHHAEILKKSDTVFQIRNLDPETGTRINGQRIIEAELHEGDRVAFGPLEGVFHLDANGSEARRPPVEPIQRLQHVFRPTDSTAIDKHQARQELRMLQEQRSRLEATISQLVAERQLQQQASQDQIIEAQKRLACIQSQQSEAERSLAELNKVRDCETETLQTVRAESEALQSQLDGLSVAKADAEAELDHLHQRLHATQIEALHAEEHLGQLLQQRSEAEVSLALLEEERSTQQQVLQRTAAESEQQCRAAQRRQAELDHEIAHLMQAHALQQQTQAQLLAEIDASRTELQKVRDEIEDSRGKLKSLGELHVQAVAKLRLAEKDFVTVDKKRVEADKRIAKLEGTEAKLLQMQKDIREGEGRHSKQLQTLAALAREQEQQQREITSLNEKIAGLKKLKLDHEQAAKTASENVATAKTSLTAFEAESAKVRIDLGNEIAGLAAQVTEARRNLETAEARRTEAEAVGAKLEGLKEHLQKTEAALTASKERLSSLNSAIKKARSESATLDQHLSKLRAAEGGMKMRIEALQSQEKSLEESLSELATREMGARNRFEEIQKLCADAERVAQEQKAEIERSLDASRRQLAQTGCQLSLICGIKKEFEGLYGKLDAMPEGSPDAVNLWHEIERHKAETADVLARLALNPALSGPDAEYGGDEAEPPAGSTPRIHSQDRRTEVGVVRQKTKLAALQQQIAMAEKEEQKRRSRLVELEHHLHEIKAQIAHAEEHLRIARHKSEVVDMARKNGALASEDE